MPALDWHVRCQRRNGRYVASVEMAGKMPAKEMAGKVPADEMAGKVPAEEMAGTLPASKWQVRCQRRMVRICLFMDGSEERFRPAILWRVAAH